MPIVPSDLIGAWRLVSWSLRHDDGRPPVYPLGEDAAGYLLYTADGHVSATLMRRGPAVPGGAGSFAYAGRYRLEDGTVYHSIEVASDPGLVGITSTRHIARDGALLTLSGPDFGAGSARTQRIVWRRAAA
ncbi:MAG: lipocalin-like domain-containing protein [Burkholderiales bacterium]|nr:lipocalin-like domain-containing protein [Burkholderiales bacterium]